MGNIIVNGFHNQNYPSKATNSLSPIALKITYRHMLPPSLKQQTKNNVLFQPLSSPVALLQSTSGSIESSPSSKTEFDSGAVLRYFIATAVELACFGASFRALDLLISKLSLTNSIPSPIIGFL